MKHVRSYGNVTRRWYRPIEHECPECHRTLRQAMTLTRRTVIRLDKVIKLIHAGYRCPDVQCPGHQRTYRSAAADALALPGFTYGLDIVLLVGQLRLGEHQTVDEAHKELLERLVPLGVRISRRRSCTCLRLSVPSYERVARRKTTSSGWHRCKQTEASSSQWMASSRKRGTKPSMWCAMR